MSTKERIKLQKQLEELKQQHITLMRGRVVPSSRAQAVQRKIIETKNQIKMLDREVADRLALAKVPVEEVLEVIALPLLADVMNDMVAGVDGMLRRHGVQETIFSVYTRQIRQATMAMVDTLAQSPDGLPNLLDVDDTLVDAVKKKLMSFIKQRLKINKTNE